MQTVSECIRCHEPLLMIFARDNDTVYNRLCLACKIGLAPLYRTAAQEVGTFRQPAKRGRSAQFTAADKRLLTQMGIKVT